MDFFVCFTFLLKTRRGLQRQNLRRLPLRSVRLCTVLATFGCSEMSFTDSAQWKPAQSPTPRSVSLRGVRLRAVFCQFWIFEKYSTLFRKINIWTPDSLYCRWRCSKTKKNSLTPHSVSLHRVRLRTVLACAESNISRISLSKRKFKRNHFNLFIRSPDGFDSWRKKSRDTATLNN